MSAKQILLAVLLVFSALTLGCTTVPKTGSFPNAPLVKLHVTVLDEQQHAIFEATDDFPVGTNALAALEQMTELTTEDSSYGKFVTGFHGKKADATQYWALYVNGEYATTGIEGIILDKDTDIEWKLEKIRQNP